jgi:hypothetical protein
VVAQIGPHLPFLEPRQAHTLGTYFTPALGRALRCDVRLWWPIRAVFNAIRFWQRLFTANFR